MYGSVRFDTAIRYAQPNRSRLHSVFVRQGIAGRPADASGKCDPPLYCQTDNFLRYTCVKNARMNPTAYAFHNNIQIIPVYFVAFR